MKSALVRDYIGSTLLKKQVRGRHFLFTVFLIILPLFILLVFELLLRITNYGGDLSLVLTRKIDGHKYYQINKHVARRYFPGDELTVPDARDAVFEYKKSAKIFRIFCLGGSTTAGFPYQYNATFSSLLYDRLHLLFPDRNFEVINVGISAINTFSVSDFTHELVHYQPDLFLIYMGHNEFYGALGVASTRGLGENRTFIKIYFDPEKSRLFLFFRSIIFKLKKTFFHEEKCRIRHFNANLVRSPAFPFAYAKLGLLFLKQNLLQQAKPYLQKAVQAGERSKQFTDVDLGRAKYLLALAFSQLNDLPAAKTAAE
ncbi:MAG: hypothetical protein GXO75_00930 [Calditrichaeota bacterium]|nr:hypothetical protein [Calditrichota bacterium]